MAGWLIIALILFFMIHPNFNRSKTRSWRGTQFAHRGLHDESSDVVENTLEAFEAACAQGFGIELDILYSQDMQVVVFHDDNLKRLAGDPRRVCTVPLDELQSFALDNVASAQIPTLKETLRLVNGRVPLLIEIKTCKKGKQLCQDLMDILKDYPGEYIVESFNPLIVGWFRRNAPHVVRGQLVCPMREYIPIVDPLSAFCMAGLLFNFIARPDFVAYDANARRFFSPHLQRFIFRTPMAGWTIDTQPMVELIQRRREMCIFENVNPSDN